MKAMLTLLLLAGLVFAVTGCPAKEETPAAPSEPTTQVGSVTPVALADQTVEAACASCIYHTDGVQSCQLAVKVDDKTYLVEGVEVDMHNDGYCSAPKQAVITGTVEGDKIIASAFKVQEPTEAQ